MWNNKTILITGGTGSFGRALVRTILERFHPKAIRIFSRDELKQNEMQGEFDNDVLRFFIGDVRDEERLLRAMNGVDIVIHAAAMKQVPACEYNPFEAVKTNILGAQNIINAAIDSGVEKVMAISTDKAVNPVNLYGATKLCAEKILIQGNSYSGKRPTGFSCVRYGNVIGSRGSVIPLFLKQKKDGILTITDKRMTRFWITLEEAVDFVIESVGRMHGGEIFIPRIPSMRILDLANVIAPGCKVNEIGIRAGEKIHEALITEEEARHTLEFDDYFVITPEFPWWGKKNLKDGRELKDGFRFSSDNNPDWLSPDDIKKLVAES